MSQPKNTARRFRTDRPGFMQRLRADGSAARYWHPRRANKMAPTSLACRKIPDDASDNEVVALCFTWTKELNDDMSSILARQHALQRHNVAIELARIYRKRAADNKWACTVDADWMEARLVSANDRCEVSRISFDYLPARKERRRYFKNPMRPSLDRMDNSGGYTPENVRLVLHCVNIGMNEWGIDQYLEVCRAVAKASPL